MLRSVNTQASPLLRCIEVHVHSRPQMSAQSFVTDHCSQKTTYNNLNEEKRVAENFIQLIVVA
jgi:hypothetical protein